MVQFAKTAAQKEKEKGGPKKPKKELGPIMDIAQVALPMIASVVGTPLMGAAVSALLEGAEAKLEGGSWKEALMKGLVSGGTGALTAGLAPGAGSAATEAGKKAGTEAVNTVTKKGVEQAAAGLTKQGASAFGVNITKDMAKNLATKNPLAQQAMADTMGKAISPGLLNQATSSFGVNMQPNVANAAAAGNPGMKAAVGAGADQAMIDTVVGAGGDATAKQRFLEHVTELGGMGAEAYAATKAEAGARRGQTEAANAQAMASRQAVMDGGRHRRQKPRYSSYGGY